MVSAATWLAALYENGTRYQHDVVWAINFATQSVAFIAVSLLVSTLSRKLKQEKVLRHTDPLTGLHNREAFLDRAGAALSLGSRHGQSCALAFVDLDNFKNANDRFGHACGDALLRSFGAIVLASLRASDVAARMGGDEFVVFLPQTGSSEAVAVAQRIVDAIHAAPDFRAALVTASVGVVIDERSSQGLSDLLAGADAQMYRAKRRGKNGVAVESAVAHDSPVFPAASSDVRTNRP